LLRLFLWHGMPIKGIGTFDPITPHVRQSCDLAIAPSKFTAGIMARSFAFNVDQIVITGEPKTDPLPADRPG
jgi:hypothetical protein